MPLASALLATIPVILIIILRRRRRRRRWHLPAARGLLVLGSLGVRRRRQWCTGTGGQWRRWSTGRWRRLDRMPHRLGRAARFLTSQRERCGWCYGCGGDGGSAGSCGSSTLLCKQLSERAHANAFGHGRCGRSPTRWVGGKRHHSAAAARCQHSAGLDAQLPAQLSRTWHGPISRRYPLLYYKMYTANARHCSQGGGGPTTLHLPCTHTCP